MSDLLSTIELTATCMLIITFMAWLFGRTWPRSLVIAGVLFAWFLVVVEVGWAELFYRSGAQPGVIATILGPVLIMSGLALGTERGRALVATAPLEGLIAIQGVRILGVSFLLLYAAGRLPAPFAPVAGVGDILVGVLALGLTWWIRQGVTPQKLQAVFAWSILGTADLVTAVSLGATSTPGPIQIFALGEGNLLIATLPWFMIPGFIVPCMLFTHILIFYRMRQLGASRDAIGVSA